MKISKSYLRKLIKEAIMEAEDMGDAKKLDLSLTPKQANVLLLALEDYREAESPEARELYDIIFDGGLDAGFGGAE